MIAKFPYLITAGQFIKIRGHNIQDHHYRQWWKVTGTEGGRLTLVNRHGRTTHIPTSTHGIKCLMWEPGDPRQDD